MQDHKQHRDNIRSLLIILLEVWSVARKYAFNPPKIRLHPASRVNKRTRSRRCVLKSWIRFSVAPSPLFESSVAFNPSVVLWTSHPVPPSAYPRRSLGTRTTSKLNWWSGSGRLLTNGTTQHKHKTFDLQSSMASSARCRQQQPHKAAGFWWLCNTCGNEFGLLRNQREHSKVWSPSPQPKCH
jgi:hypothetical protein